METGDWRLATGDWRMAKTVKLAMRKLHVSEDVVLK